MKDNRNKAIKIIDTYNNYWIEYDFKDLSWNESISEGKATIAEIIGHLLNWDKYLISSVIPSVINGDGMVFPEFDTFNKLGYEYVRSKPKSLIINEFNDTRKHLSNLLLNSLEIIDRPTTANGVYNC